MIGNCFFMRRCGMQINCPATRGLTLTKTSSAWKERASPPIAVLGGEYLITCVILTSPWSPTSTSHPRGLSNSTDSIVNGSCTSERQPPRCSCRSPRRRLGVPRHHFGSENLDGAHGLPMAEIAPLERADEVVGTGGHILVHVLAYRSRGAGQRHAAEPIGMLASCLLVKTLQLGVDVPPHFTCR